MGFVREELSCKYKLAMLFVESLYISALMGMPPR